MRIPTALALMLASEAATASPPIEVAELLRRVPTVVLVTIDTARPTVTLHAKTTYRGAIARDQYARIETGKLPDGVSTYVVLVGRSGVRIT